MYFHIHVLKIIAGLANLCYHKMVQLTSILILQVLLLNL